MAGGGALRLKYLATYGLRLGADGACEGHYACMYSGTAVSE